MPWSTAIEHPTFYPIYTTMLLIAYPQLNFWHHPESGLSYLRDEESSDTAVLFHCLSPAALATVPAADLERIHLDIAAAYNNHGATEEEKDLPALPVSFIERPDARPPADLPEWFAAIAADGSRGTWIIHTGAPLCAFRFLDQGCDLCIHSGPTPGKATFEEAKRQLHRLARPGVHGQFA